tara:strand:- start:762 stop:1016 length:255 start_codon:yes stop_codon:yes gene_type:complete
MNIHILLVIDHLANPDKYSQEELNANRKSAWAAYYAASAYRDAYRDAYSATDAATYYATASYWVDEYFKRTGEDKQTYIDALGE